MARVVHEAEVVAILDRPPQPGLLDEVTERRATTTRVDDDIGLDHLAVLEHHRVDARAVDAQRLHGGPAAHGAAIRRVGGVGEHGLDDGPPTGHHLIAIVVRSPAAPISSGGIPSSVL